jgi:indolepyruvate ferredoxin oxidoreductase
MTELLGDLTPERLAVLQEIAALPMILRGYGHVKIASLERYETERQALLRQWHEAPTQEAA